MVKGYPKVDWPSDWAWKTHAHPTTPFTPWWRRCLPLHPPTGLEVMVCNDDGQVLMAKWNEAISGFGRYGGYLDHDEHPTGCVRRPLRNSGSPLFLAWNPSSLSVSSTMRAYRSSPSPTGQPGTAILRNSPSKPKKFPRLPGSGPRCVSSSGVVLTVKLQSLLSTGPTADELHQERRQDRQRETHRLAQTWGVRRHPRGCVWRWNEAARRRCTARSQSCFR